MYIDSTFEMPTVCPLDPPPQQHDNSLLSFLFPSPDATAQGLCAAPASALSLSLSCLSISLQMARSGSWSWNKRCSWI